MALKTAHCHQLFPRQIEVSAYAQKSVVSRSEQRDMVVAFTRANEPRFRRRRFAPFDPRRTFPSLDVNSRKNKMPQNQTLNATSTDGGASTPDTTDMTQTLSDSVSALMRGELTDASTSLLVKVILPAATALVIFVVAYFAASLISRWTAGFICRKVDKTLGKFAGKLAFYGIIVVTAVTVLPFIGVEVAGFAAILAAAGFAIGLAFQGTLSNFASGVLLLVFRPFKVGDVINAAGVLGKVNEIDLFTTTLDTPDNRRLIVPNSSIAGATIENVSFHAHRRVEVLIGVEYSADLDATREVLIRCAETLSDRMVTGEGRGYQVLLAALNSSSVDWKVRFWTASKDFFSIQEALTTLIKRELDIAGIGIPFPQMQLHLSEQQTARVASHAGAEQILPIPKMNIDPAAAHRTSKVRPRVRGNTGN